jgi:hypothetical protein
VIGLGASDDPQGGPPRINFSERIERLWTPEQVRGIPEFHGLVWQSGSAQPQPVYCPPYWEIKELKGRYDPDPYHPGSNGGGISGRFARAATGAALIAAVVVAGVVALSMVPFGL